MDLQCIDHEENGNSLRIWRMKKGGINLIINQDEKRIDFELSKEDCELLIRFIKNQTKQDNTRPA